jgi:hypothetical protein
VVGGKVERKRISRKFRLSAYFIPWHTPRNFMQELHFIGLSGTLDRPISFSHFNLWIAEKLNAWYNKNINQLVSIKNANCTFEFFQFVGKGSKG